MLDNRASGTHLSLRSPTVHHARHLTPRIPEARRLMLAAQDSNYLDDVSKLSSGVAAVQLRPFRRGR